MHGQSQMVLSDTGSLSQFGGSVLTLEPKAKSSTFYLREELDEFVIITKSELIPLDDNGQTDTKTTNCAICPVFDPNWHFFKKSWNILTSFLVFEYPSENHTGH